MGIGEKHTHVCQFLHGRRMYLLCVRILCEELVGRAITQTHVVRHKQNHIGPVKELSRDGQR